MNTQASIPHLASPQEYYQVHPIDEAEVATFQNHFLSDQYPSFSFGTNSIGAAEVSFFPPSITITPEAEEYISQNHLEKSLDWLKTTAPGFFHGARFLIDLSPLDDDESEMITLEVFASFPVPEFREQTHQLCEKMRREGHDLLDNLIGIFQRRSKTGEW